MRPHFLLLCLFTLKAIFLPKIISDPAPYNAIFSFGDSLADTGNFIRITSINNPVINELPYGTTYFHHPTGRCSDGRLIVDFLAEAYGLPLLPPYLDKTQANNFSSGVNFAIAGATALDAKVFYDMKVDRLLWTNKSLTDQLQWFTEFKSSLCTTKKDCNEYLGKSLFIVGEIGGNDYNYLLRAGRGVDQAQSLVPQVVKAIAAATTMLIEEGARELVVPGNLPIGCSAVFLTLYPTQNKSDFDPRTRCLKAFNEFAEHHNNQLKIALESLRMKYPHAKIIYADYYGASQRFFHSPLQYGFKNGTLTACCGGGGPFNFNITARCGHVGSKVCSDPSTFANWDGIHLTEASYRHIAVGLLNGTYSSPPMSPPTKDQMFTNEIQ